VLEQRGGRLWSRILGTAHRRAFPSPSPDRAGVAYTQRPPSTGRIVPVTKSDWSLAR
jgi:hypothetical protein